VEVTIMDIDVFLGLRFAVLVWVVVCVFVSGQDRIDRFQKWFPFTKYPRFRRKQGKS
jgi:hypothetical protein